MHLFGRSEYMEEWSHSDVPEREHWGNESLRYLLLQVLLLEYRSAVCHRFSDGHDFVADPREGEQIDITCSPIESSDPSDGKFRFEVHCS